MFLFWCCFVFLLLSRLQYNYTQDHKGSKISAKALYDIYLEKLTAYSIHCKPISKTQLVLIVPRLFKSVQVVYLQGYRVYKGLKENFNCTEKYDFFNMNSNKDVKYAFPSGHCISQNDVLKITEIKEDMSWRLVISGHEVDPKCIGLENVMCKTKGWNQTTFQYS